MVAVPLADVDQVTEAVTSPLLPSVYVAVAVKACVSPTDRVALAGATVMLTISGAPTASVVESEMPPEVAAIVAVPIPELVASPFEPAVLLTIATVASEVDHVTVVVMSFCAVSV